MKRFLLALALLLAPAFACASPLVYTPAPLDTYQAGLASVYANLNANLALAAPLSTVTGSAGASTINSTRFTVTTESLTTTAAAVYTETVTNSAVTAASVALCTVGIGTATTGVPALSSATPAAGSLVVKIQNIAASAALNGTLTISCLVSN